MQIKWSPARAVEIYPKDRVESCLVGSSDIAGSPTSASVVLKLGAEGDKVEALVNVSLVAGRDGAWQVRTKGTSDS